MKAARKLFVGGNWKCNGTRPFIKDFSKNVLNKMKYNPDKMEVLIAPVAMHLHCGKKHIKNGIHISAQNSSGFDCGAYTGEIAAEQLHEFDIDWTILGHSERRHIYGESSEFIGKKRFETLWFHKIFHNS